ncbi:MULTISPECIES: N-acyl amino acid synthase FeeM domain-containing protein [Ochrobactrum]|uniref:Acetyltransferase n=1 Tax=Ochrobactrum chromiisoli TaxID=2993941 RepID=A0ABT3QTD1_9HYPH|nr:acetyltransferase [Ochrobactrum chromiisoli]MCX2698875.1 acetyltransferase [Ochrobactrum chromiisoli]
MSNEAVSGGQPPLSNFARQLLQFLDRVEYRRIVHAEDLEEIGRLRYRSYRSANVMHEADVPSIVDDVDCDSHAFVFGIHIDGQLVSTLRIHHITPDHRRGTSYALFPDILDPLLNAGMSFVDPTRFAADPELLSEYPAIPYVTLRIAAMASEYFEADQCLASVKPEHMAFYKRIFGTSVMAEAREHEGYGIRVGLGAAPIRNIRDAVAVRFPFFKSQPHERRAMFGELVNGVGPLTILPTAKYTGLGV